MVRIKNGEYLAIIGSNRMIEVHADSQDEAEQIVSDLCDDEDFMVCRIPSIIGYVGR